MCLYLLQPIASCSGQTLHLIDRTVPEIRSVAFVDSGWIFQGESPDLQLDAPRLVRWGGWQGIRKSPAVWLDDGSWLAGGIQMRGAGLTIESQWLESCEVALDRVRAIVLQPPPSQSAWAHLWKELQSLEGTQDSLWLVDGTRITGIVRWQRSDFAANVLQVSSAGQQIALPLEKISAIATSPALIDGLPVSNQRWSIGLRDGSLLRAASLATKGAGSPLTIQAANLNLVSLDSADRFCREITYLRDLRADTTFLSDLPVANYKQVSKLSLLRWKLGVDRDVHGLPLATKHGIVDKGLALHSPSQVAFRWHGAAGRLHGEVCFAPVVPGAEDRIGSVGCRVVVVRDGKLETIQQFVLDRDAGDGQAEIVDVDIEGADLIVLIADEDNMGSYGDHILWLDMRTSPPAN